MKISIRRATRNDLPLLVDFNQQMALETEGKPLNLNKLRLGTEAVFQNPNLGFYLVAERGESVAGQLMITYEWSDWRNARMWWIQSVFIHPEARGLGIYRRLHNHVLDLAKRDNACGVRLYVDRSNSVAQKVYEKCGMSRSHYDLFELDLEAETGNPKRGLED